MPPDFFLDRNLGTRVVPGILREAGWSIHTLADIYGENQGQSLADEDWLQYAGTNGLAVLTNDKHIRRHRVEKDALVAHGVIAFTLSSGNLTGVQQAETFLRHEPKIFRTSSAPRTGDLRSQPTRGAPRRVGLSTLEARRRCLRSAAYLIKQGS